MKLSSLVLPPLLLATVMTTRAAPDWTLSLTDKAITYLAADSRSNTVWAAGNDGAQNVYVYKSADGGLTWGWAGNGLGKFTVYSFASAFPRPQSLLIGGWNQVTKSGAVYKSDDGGTTWTDLSAKVGNQPAQAVSFGSDTEQTLLIGTDQLLWTSYDGGSTFGSGNTGPCAAINVHAIASDNQSPNTTWFGLDQSTCGGTYVSPDSGRTLANASNGLSGSVLALAADGANNQGMALASGAAISSGVPSYALWRTPNRGQNWWFVANTDPIWSIAWDGANDSNAYFTSSTGLYVSHDQGNRFDYASEAGTNGPVGLLSNPARIITGSSRGVAVFDLASGSIPRKLPSTSNPAPAAGPAVRDTPLPTPAGSGQSLTSPQTGHTVSGIWLDFVTSHGGTDVFGYPRTEVIADPVTGLTVQYFQRFVLEWHPEVNQIGRRLLTDLLHPGLDPPVPNPSPLALLFPQTDHTVSNVAPNGDFTGFRTFFESHGGETTFAYPLEEPKLINGRWTQRFQAAVMEAHPENPEPFKVQLELLGDEYIRAKGLPFR